MVRVDERESVQLRLGT